MKILNNPTIISVTYTGCTENEMVHNVSDLENLIATDKDIQSIEITTKGENIKQVEKVLFDVFYAEIKQDSFIGHNKFNFKGLVLSPSIVTKVLKNNVSVEIEEYSFKIKKNFVFIRKQDAKWAACSKGFLFVNETSFTDGRLIKWADGWA